MLTQKNSVKNINDKNSNNSKSRLKNISKIKKSDASIQTSRTSVIGAGQGKLADFCIQDVNTK